MAETRKLGNWTEPTDMKEPLLTQGDRTLEEHTHEFLDLACETHYLILPSLT